MLLRHTTSTLIRYWKLNKLSGPERGSTLNRPLELRISTTTHKGRKVPIVFNSYFWGV